ncbi:MAG: methyltransferase domain-containing protein [Acidobacteriota bacterium]|nr:methyltransferase domain-containing protein [Acidobacteriota bacterium]
MKTTLLFLMLALGAVAHAQEPQQPFEPTSGQAGKDVVWVPSPPAMVSKMLEVAKVTPNDFVMDLGSGDGRNIIAAAKLGARGVGVEYNPDMVVLSRKLAAEAGVADKAQFVEGDMYAADISKASVLALFLLPVNLNRLAPKFLEMTPGSRIVGNTFGIDGWEPDERLTLEPESSDCASWCEVLLWIVPAKAQGQWKMANGMLELFQTYQMVEGSITVDGTKHTISNRSLRGDELTFIAGGFTYQGKFTGNELTGTITTPSGQLPWRAVRQQ